MDDEIDIEEHDILEHPLVKAVFADLSKIQIQVHTGASFLDETSIHTEESLLEERLDYAENDTEEKSQDVDSKLTDQAYAVNLIEDNYEEEFLEDTLSENDVIEEAHKISDKACNDVVSHTDTENNLVNEIQEISDDEFIDNAQVCAASKVVNNAEEIIIAEFNEGANIIANSSNSKDNNLKELRLGPELVQNVHEISDDEESREIEELENCADFEEAPENIADIEEEQGNGTGFKDTLANGAAIEKEEENDADIEEAQEYGDELVEKTPLIKNHKYGTNDYVVKYITEQNIHTIPQHSEGVTNIHEYPHVPIKDEIYEVPIKKEFDDDYEMESYTNFDVTLPDETFIRNESPEEDHYFNNKIILGSKPSPRIQFSNSGVSSRKLSVLVVLLEDWGVRLNQSSSFCDDCKILFTTPNALDAHRMIAHSLLAPITNRAVKSTAKSSKGARELKNIAKKSTGSVTNKVISNSTYCNHCNVTFKDHTALIKHLYELLPAKNNTCKFCNETFKTQNDLVNHNMVHVKIEPRRILKAKKNSDKNPILRNLLTKEQIFPAKSHPKAVKRSHPKSVKRQPVETKRELSTDYLEKCMSRYKCMICNQILRSYGRARKHRNSHPETQTGGKKYRIMFKKLKAKKYSPNNSKDKFTYEEDSKNSLKNVSGQKKLRLEQSQSKVGRIKDKAFNLIAKSALFQCSKCSVHFASCIAGTAHFTGNKCGAKPSWSCPTCKKKLRKIDENYHRKQHEISTKLKIYKITKNTNERTLCKCLKCGVHFDYILLKMHINRCGKIPTAKCKRCNILLARHKLPEHVVKHDVLKLKPADFIFVDYAVEKDKTKSKPKIVATKKSKNKTVDKKPVKKAIARRIKVEPGITVKKEPVSAKERLKIINKLTFEQDKVSLYYCKHCKHFLSKSANIARTIKYHFEKTCLRKKNITFFCGRCGLQFSLPSRKKHEAMHTKMDLSLKDFEFYDFATLKPMTPPIPEYPSCKKCKIHFLVRSMSKDHICGEDYDNCEYCGEKFEFSALKVHKPFHKLQSKNPKTDLNELSPTKIIPELMMKYESLNAIWNILFICGKCELVTDLYNKTVEHSQAHLEKEPSQPSTIKCYICNLKFEESCWSKHSELHSRMNITRKDFKILKYAPNKLLDESWFQMFETLPEKEIRQIIDRSVFGSERSLKMRLVKDGLPEFTVYCCSNCEVSYDNNSILDHVKSKCKISKHVCKKCDIAFDAANTLSFHELLHQRGIKKDEFRIVQFVKISDEIDTNSSKNQNKVKVNRKSVVNSRKLDLERKKRVINKVEVSLFVLYKCLACSACVHLKMSMAYHVCAPDHHLMFCKICKQNFYFRQMVCHKAKHKGQPQFRAKNIKIISFEPNPDAKGRKQKRPPKTKYRNASAASSKTTNKQLASKSSESDPTSLHSEIDLTSSSSSKSKPTRSSVDSFESLVNLITNEKATTSKGRKNIKRSQSLLRVSVPRSETDLEAEDIKIVKIYKCDCGLHYTSLRTIQNHMETCNNDDRISKENCSRCGLLFPTDILVSHLCKHHSQDTIITVEPMHKKSNEVEAASTQGNKSKTSSSKDYVKLYKCGVCNVYFLNQNSCYKHTSKHEALDPKQYIECKMCCLQFRILSLHIHMKKHHEKEFNLEKVLVEEYHPSVGKQAPKIDIYFASDRFQNVQVSSSND